MCVKLDEMTRYGNLNRGRRKGQVKELLIFTGLASALAEQNKAVDTGHFGAPSQLRCITKSGVPSISISAARIECWELLASFVALLASPFLCQISASHRLMGLVAKNSFLSPRWPDAHFPDLVSIAPGPHHQPSPILPFNQ